MSRDTRSYAASSRCLIIRCCCAALCVVSRRRWWATPVRLTRCSVKENGRPGADSNRYLLLGRYPTLEDQYQIIAPDSLPVSDLLSESVSLCCWDSLARLPFSQNGS